ncbi:polysaccharide deacetylase family protein [Streptomyces tsukubensis]|uniref:polysaccharide deacetylase family protein n=1 Tax=Streptomyces tsukubensis TaxID=83656 RepID=UPI003F4E78EC
MSADTAPPRNQKPATATAALSLTAVAAPVATAVRRPWILMYHSVSDPAHDPYGITVSPDRLDLQLRWLRARGLTGVSVAALLRACAQGRGRGLVGLTFDDGYADFADGALPVLRRHDCTATLFVLPGRLGGDNVWDPDGPRRPLIDEDGIRSAVASGTEIASHGLYHVDLTRLDDDALREETLRSRAWLREVTGRDPEGFCYPYGTVDGRVASAVRSAGYAYGCAIRPPAGLGGPYALPRTHISQADRAVRLWAKRAGHRAGLR